MSPPELTPSPVYAAGPPLSPKVRPTLPVPCKSSDPIQMSEKLPPPRALAASPSLQPKYPPKAGGKPATLIRSHPLSPNSDGWVSPPPPPAGGLATGCVRRGGPSVGFGRPNEAWEMLGGRQDTGALQTLCLQGRGVVGRKRTQHPGGSAEVGQAALCPPLQRRPSAFTFPKRPEKNLCCGAGQRAAAIRGARAELIHGQV